VRGGPSHARLIKLVSLTSYLTQYLASERGVVFLHPNFCDPSCHWYFSLPIVHDCNFATARNKMGWAIGTSDFDEQMYGIKFQMGDEILRPVFRNIECLLALLDFLVFS
jgi:hypothetical protein